ncbi:MAG: hypothetical protein O3C57_05925 [Verrucomicrobia bacterium]|nr:hypothetical protein [Verrucomicrobiota bacterium]
MTTTQLFLDHFWASLTGTLSLLIKHPVFGARLLFIRAAYLRKRRLIKEIRDPYGFQICSESILISYWAIIVEPMLRRHAWAKAFRAEATPSPSTLGPTPECLRIFSACSILAVT